jgi:glycosyltransferase involved in cell wall biosynthesis
VTRIQPKVLWVYGYANTFGGSFNVQLDILRQRDPGSFAISALLPAAGNVSREFEALGVPAIFQRPVAAGKNTRYVHAVWSARRLLRREKVDLVYFADYATWRPPLLVAAYVAAVPVVVHLRSPISDEFASDRWLRSARAIIGNSRATLRALRGRVPDEMLHVVSNFVDFARFVPGPDRRTEFFPQRCAVVGFVGIFRPEKGIEYFLDMAKIVRATRPDVRYLAVGGESAVRDRGWFEKMRGYAAEIGVADVICFTGSRSDIPAIMRSVDVLVVPSLNEGFGLVIVEANAVGTPVIGANAAGIPEVIEDGVTGLLVPPRDPVAMAAAVLRVLDDSAWRARVAALAPRRVRERFAPDQQVAAIAAIWRGALSR